MVDNLELEKFRDDWHNELDYKPKNKKIKSDSQNDSGGKADQNLPSQLEHKHIVHLQTDDSNDSLKDDGLFDDINSFSPMNNIIDAQKKPNTMKSFLIAERLLSGENPHTSVSHVSRNMSSVDRKAQSESKEKNPHNESYLDIFLKDLEEINQIPFFDNLMPREIALNIFQYLDKSSLGCCAQVSKAWLSIAEDELLWSNICHYKGFDLDLNTNDAINWKERMKKHQQRKQNIKNNWMGRYTGAVYDLQHVHGGVLCCVHSDTKHVVAGFSNGDIKLWRLPSSYETDDSNFSESICIFRPSSTSLQVDESTESGTVTNHPTCVCLNEDYIAAGYSLGYVDMWSLEGESTSPIHSYKCADPISHICLFGSLIACASNNQLRLENRDWNYSHIEDLDHPITYIRFFASTTSSKIQLSLSAGHKLVIYMISYDSITCKVSLSSNNIHNTFGHTVSAVATNGQRIVYGLRMDYGWVKGYTGKLILHDLTSSKTLSTHKGDIHTGIFRALHYFTNHEEQNMFCSGAADKTVRIYDSRINNPCLEFKGHESEVTNVQMDEWKCVSGSSNGTVCVWDQRLQCKIWDYHNRHPVNYLKFDNHLLLSANVPINKFPITSDWDNIPHKRQRGQLQFYDFSNTTHQSKVLDICQSNYQSPDQYNYNIRLAVPYD